MPILYPKLSNRFGVYFTAATQYAPDLAKQLLSRLTLQVLTAQLPKQTFQAGAFAPGPTHKFFKTIKMIGPLVLTLEDDATNQLAEALEFATRQCSELNVVVARLDGNEGVLEAYLFGGARFESVEFSELDYSCGSRGSGSITGNLTVPDVGGINNAATISAHFSLGGLNNTQRRIVSLLPTYSQYYRSPLDANAASIAALLGDI